VAKLERYLVVLLMQVVWYLKIPWRTGEDKKVHTFSRW